MDGQHHAYDQPENVDHPMEAVCAGLHFHGCPWMFSQALEFVDMIKKVGHLFKINVHGDGLLAHILKTGAEPELLKEV
jgi:hypothetical protein